MQAETATRIERHVDRTASLLFAMAAGYAAWSAFAWRLVPLERGAAAGAIATLVWLMGFRLLEKIEPEPRKLPVPVFDVREIDAVAPEELLLTERYEPAEEPLVLEDILGEIEPDSRVVRLFDPAAMPTPGQLNDRIQRHLVRGAPPAPPQDASQALHDALAELRRSLR